MKNHNYIAKHPFVSLAMLLTLCSLMIVISMIVAAKSQENQAARKKLHKQVQENAQTTAMTVDGELIGVIKNINLVDREITLIDVDTEEETVFSYIGGTDIRDKFEQIISMSQLSIGQVVEAGYQKKNQKLMKLYVSKDAWEYQKLSNLMIDKSSKQMKIGNITYEYGKSLIVLFKGALSELYQLHEMDEVTVRGYSSKVCSISITKGHGTIALTDDEDFIGGTINVGTAAYDTITKEMVLTVREGNYNLTVENGKYSGTKNINVFADERTEVSIGDFGPEAIKMGKVQFDINPFGADLIIDGELMSYKSAFELAYGSHDIEVSLGGYTSYEGELVVDTASKRIRIDLIENIATNLGQTGGSSADRPGFATRPSQTTEVNMNDNNTGGSSELPPDIMEEFDSDTEEDYLVDEDHFIYIQNPEGASVYLNGVYKLTSPGSFEKVIGTHYITFIKEGYETKSYTIEVEDDGLDAYFNFPDLGESAD